MANEELTIIISSREAGDKMTEYIEMVKNNCGCPCKMFFVTNEGTMSLTELYGGMLANTNIDSRYVLFMHDDLEILKPGFGAEILRIFKNSKLGILGVAGSDYFGSKDSDGSESMWWSYKDNTWGQVLHKANGKSWLTCFSGLIDKDYEEVCVVDGLFFAVDKKRIKKNFDKAIKGFDFYEIDFCLANYLEGVKIGVTTNIRLAHKSVGNLKDSWFTNREIVARKYEDELPIKVPKKKVKR